MNTFEATTGSARVPASNGETGLVVDGLVNRIMRVGNNTDTRLVTTITKLKMNTALRTRLESCFLEIKY